MNLEFTMNSMPAKKVSFQKKDFVLPSTRHPNSIFFWLLSVSMSLGIFYSVLALADPSQIDLPTGIKCYHALQSLIPGQSGYPKGYVAVAGSHGTENGAFLFSTRTAKFFPELEPFGDGYMEFYGDSKNDFSIEMRSGTDALNDDSRGYLAEHIQSEINRFYTLFLKSKGHGRPNSRHSKEQLSPANAEAMTGTLTRAFQSTSFFGPPKTQLGQSTRKHNPSDPDSWKHDQNMVLLDSVSSQFEATGHNQEHEDDAVKIDREKLKLALKACEQVKDEKKISSKATELLVKLTGGSSTYPAASSVTDTSRSGSAH